MAARILYVPNEHGDARQSGVRKTLARLLDAGLIDDVRVFSLLWRIREGMAADEQRRALLDVAEAYRPDILLMQHLGGTGLRRHEIETMKVCSGSFIYHEADPYSRFLHPLPREARDAGRTADIVFTVGSGVFAANFRRAGARDVRWMPSIFDPERFGSTPPRPVMRRDFDVVMVANRNRPRLRGLPNWRDRIAFVDYMARRFGRRFAIYGRGWDGPSAVGPVAYSDQSAAIRSGWISANWDHFSDEPRYFSDRLPTTLASGSVHATTFHPGFGDIFEGTRGFLLLSRDRDALGDMIENYLGKTTPEERFERERQAWAYAHRTLRQDDQVVKILNAGGAGIDANQYARARDATVATLSEM